MTARGGRAAGEQFDIFGEVSASGWPPHSRFPYNDGPVTVGGLVTADLEASRAPLVITGYASLDRLVEWLARCHAGEARRPGSYTRIRLVLGHEPTPTSRTEFRGRAQDLPAAVAEYWLERGISLHLSAKVLAAVDLLHRGLVEVRTSGERVVHAKVHAGDDAITIGSSNFSAAGLSRQIEVNARFTHAEPERFAEAWRAAEVVWAESHPYTTELEALLTALLQVVNWQDALARACAELLEGKWAERYAAPSTFVDGPELWPAQEQGIAHALWVLESQGSVLVADATGSGKTRMGAHLARRVLTRAWRRGHGRHDVPVLVAPPHVSEAWEREALSCGLPLQVYSYGHLSHPASGQHARLLQAIRRAQLLVVDEAHGFLRRSRRTKAVLANTADHVLLFTATPVSRGPRDMLAIIDLLGADNLDEATLAILVRLWRRRGDLDETMSAGERGALRRAIHRFTLRRTKADLGRLIEQAPERYRDRQGRLCAYPRHQPVQYDTGETEADREIAAQIRAATSRPRGIALFHKPLEVSESQRGEGVSDDAYLAWRLRGAAALARHHVMASLRSSRARLLEELYGTTAAAAELRIAAPKRNATPGVFAKLTRLAGSPPPVRLTCAAPEWLRDPAAHAAAAAEERRVYDEIARFAAGLSTARERTKAALLLRLVREHGLVLAFDTHLITLAALNGELQAAGGREIEVVLATGEHVAGRRRLYDLFRQDSAARGVVGLCSDALSEGVNLQAASAVVLLDMPSVLRVAEQRIGRVDRLDSPHASIAAYWPKDSPEFALRAGERFVERHRFVADHLGSNLPLPAEMGGAGEMPADDAVVSAEDDAAELERQSRDGAMPDDLWDAFAPVRALVSGDRALVPARLYEQMRRSTARVVSSVSVVEASERFAFVAVTGTAYGAPRWAYLDLPAGAPVTDLDAVSEALRRHLTGATRDRAFDAPAADALDAALAQLEQHEELLLPRGKQRALGEMRHVLGGYRRSCPREDTERLLAVDSLLAAAAPTREQGTNLSALAEWWLEVIQPARHRHLAARRRTTPVLLKHLRPDLKSDPLATAVPRSAFARDLSAPPLAERVAAAILGVP